MMRGLHLRAVPLLLCLAVGSALGQTVIVFQPGAATVEGQPNAARMTGTRPTPDATNPPYWTNEGQEVYVRQNLGSGIIDFPWIVGTGAGQIPPGRVVQSATLELYCTRVSGPLGTTANSVVQADLVLDPDRFGSWHEPAQPGSQQFRAGVTHSARDTRLLPRGGPAPVGLNWDATGQLRPSTNAVINEPLAPSSANPRVTVNRFNPRIANTVREAEWHTFDVTSHVRFWVERGRSNQGWTLTGVGTGVIDVWYASDEHADPSLRPRLRVTLAANSVATANRVPRFDGSFPQALAMPQGGELAFFLYASDPDGPTPEIVVQVAPEQGTLQRVGTNPIWVYRPRADFVGVDGLTVYVRDAVSAAHPIRLPIDVVARPGAQTAIFQEGVHPASALAFGETRLNGTLARIQAPGFGQTYAQQDFGILPSPSTSIFGFQAFLAMPEVVGAGASRIPPGARILSATLELRARFVPTSSPPERRVLEARRIIDPFLTRRPWREVPGALASPSFVTGQAVSFGSRDESALPVEDFLWEIPGGNAHPGEAASFATTSTDPTAGGLYALDVTRAVQAFADGEPNLGWVLRAASPHTTINTFWSDDAPVPGDRPRLIVHYLPPGSAPLAIPVPPRADAGPDRIVFVNERVTLDGRGSLDAQGLDRIPPTLIWLQTSGPTVTLTGAASATPSFTAPSTASELTFFVGAIGMGGTIAGDEVRVTVLAQPGGGQRTPLTVSAGGSRSALELATIALQGQVLTQGGGTRSFRWTQLAGPRVIELRNANTLSPSFQLPPIGSSPVTLVFDLSAEETHSTGYVSRHRDEAIITIQPSNNQAPVASAGPNQSAEPLDWIEVDASGSSDPEGHPLLFTWRHVSGPFVDVQRYVPQGSGSSARIPLQIPLVAVPETIVLEVQVSDRELARTARVNIQVTPPPLPFAGSLTNQPLQPYRETLHPEEARHLLRRLGGGWHDDDVRAVRQAGLTPTVQSMLTLRFDVDPDPFNAVFMRTPREVQDEAFLNAPVAYAPGAPTPALNQPLFDLWPQYQPRQGTAAWVVHAFRSPNALAERMANFWHHRLAVSTRDLPLGQQHAIPPHLILWRERAFDAYPEILTAFVRDPVTLSFIDGFNNLRFAPNENFAREFFELHALGVFDPFSPNGATRIFTQNDIVEAARAFTGWRPVCYALTGTIASCYPGFVPFFHDPTAKTVLGLTGPFDDALMVDLVLRQFSQGRPAARWLAKGLIEWFVMFDPPLSLVDEVATLLLNENWNIEVVLGRLLTSRAFFAPEARKSLVKSPVELAQGIVHTLRIPLQTRDLTSYGDILGLLERCGEEPMNPLDVDGWVEDLGWFSDERLIQRFNLVDRLLELGVAPNAPGPLDRPGIAPTPIDLIDPWLPPPTARRAPEVVERVSRMLDVTLLRTPAPGHTRSEFDLAVEYLETLASLPQGTPTNSYVGTFAPFSDARADRDAKLIGLLVLLMEHPDFQRL